MERLFRTVVFFSLITKETEQTLWSNTFNKFTTSQLLLNIKTQGRIQGRIQCSSSYANGEVVLPSYEMLNRLKNVQEVSLYSQTIYAYFPADFD